MTAFGIDFGGSRLRVALADVEGTWIIAQRRATLRMPIAPGVVEDGTDTVRFEINSLKRVLDFDSAVRYSEKQLPPLDRLVEILAELRRELPHADRGPPACVVAVPGCFPERQRSALREAFLRAGIVRLRLMDDAIAAVRESRPMLPHAGNVLVVSWGAVALSVSLFRLQGERPGAVAQEGAMDSGGDDIDAAIAAHIWNGFRERVREAHELDAGLAKNLVREAMRARELLAEGRGAKIAFRELIGNRARAESVQDLRVAPDVFEGAQDRALSRTLDMIGRVLATAGVSRPDSTLAVGAMAGHRRVAAALEERFGTVVRAGENAVAIGAALTAQQTPDSEWEQIEQKLAVRAPVPRGGSAAKLSAREARANGREREKARPSARPLTRMLAERLGGSKRGRNDLCECGSGKKRKKCHGMGE